MPNLSIKGVPETLADALRQRAAINHRSLQGELMSIIESAVAARSSFAAPGTSDFAPYYDPQRRGTVVSVDARGRPVVRRGSKTVTQIAAELRAQFPNPVKDGPNSVDIIRTDRDSR